MFASRSEQAAIAVVAARSALPALMLYDLRVGAGAPGGGVTRPRGRMDSVTAAVGEAAGALRRRREGRRPYAKVYDARRIRRACWAQMTLWRRS